MAIDLHNFTQWRESLFQNSFRSIYPLKFGMTQQCLIHQFGQPDDFSTEKPPLILKYEDIEFHFDKENHYQLFLIYNEQESPLTILFEKRLYQTLENVCDQLQDDNKVYYHLFSLGFEHLKAYKQAGGTIENAYNTIHSLYLDNRERQGLLCEYKEDLLADWLDCICGFVGNPQLRLW